MLFFLLRVCEISYKKKLALNGQTKCGIYSGILLALKRKRTF